MGTKSHAPLDKHEPQRQPDHHRSSPMVADVATSSQPAHQPPSLLSPAMVLRLQRSVGNRSVTRLLQRAGQPTAIQRDDRGDETGVVTMDPLRVTGDRGGGVENNVSNLDRLRGQGRDPNDIEMAHDDESVARNSPNPNQRLPFTNTGWDANEIMTRLGQYDTLAGTDSDSTRCVQAVAMVSHIPSGPDAVVGYLSSAVFDGMLSRGLGDRQRTAMQVIDLVKGRITARRATYGDLSWAQEAIHDLFYNDVSGTPGQANVINQQITPTLDGLSRNTQTLNIWCNTPAEVVAQANALPPGGQLIVTAWTVVFNNAFDQVEEQGGQTRDRMQVRVNGRLVWIRRIPTDRRPRPQDINLPSDSKSGHQLLIIKDNDQSGTTRLYEPEITKSGQHLASISPSGQELATYLRDDPQNGIYGYIQIMGKVIPQQAVSFTGVQP